MKQLFSILLVVIIITLTGCAKKDNYALDSLSSTSNNSSTIQETNTNLRTSEELFSKRDKDSTYEKETAISITLNQESATCNSNAVTISGSTITISDEGTYLLSGSLKSGMIIIDAENTDKIRLVLNNVSIQCDTSAPIYVKKADKVFITLADDSYNTLTTSEEFTAIDDNNIDGVIFSKDDLTLNGTGTLTLESNYGHGIVSKDELIITSGTYIITTAKHALSGKDSICISDGTFTINAGKDGIHGANKDDASLGFVYIAGGTFDITAEDDGIHTDADLTILAGTITVSKSYEGLEGKSIIMEGGTVTITASDDGVNASDGSGSDMKSNNFPPSNSEIDSSIYIHISGGTLSIDAYGDGIDSNGNLYIEGGEIFVSGSETGGNSALDYDGEAKITGGMVAAAGFSSMAQNFGNASTQGSILVNFETQTAKTEVSLKDNTGNTLISYTPIKQYDSIVFSHPDIIQGNSYTIYYGDKNIEVSMETLIYGSGNETGGGFRKHKDKQPPNGQMPPDNQELPSGQMPPDNQELPNGQIFPDNQDISDAQTL